MEFNVIQTPNILPDPKLLMKAVEPFAAGYCECPDATPSERYARAYRRWFEQGPLPSYGGGHLYPSGLRSTTASIMAPWYPFTFSWNQGLLDQRLPQMDSDTRQSFQSLQRLAEGEKEKINCLYNGTHDHFVGGAGWTHGIVHYGRVLAEGLDGYETRVHAGLARAADARTQAFYTGLLDLLAGIRTYHSRSLELLRQCPASNPHRERLIAALSRVPFQPARSFYEAMVAHNFVYYLDDCDNPGRLDAVLWPYYQIAPNREEAIAILSEFSDNVSANNGWSTAIGGSNADGTPAYQEMTEIVLAATHGRFRPTLELRVRPDMPDTLWDAAFDSLASGNGQPAFYNEHGYLTGLRESNLGLTEEDLIQWNGGGCTETMIQGCSNVGSIDAGFNLALVLANTLRRLLEDETVTFEQILTAFRADLKEVIQRVLSLQVNPYLAARALHRPQPMRSLLTDDCIDRGRDFNDEGARYNWSIVNVAGLANVADSLEALRNVMFTNRVVTPGQFRDILEHNFEGHEALRLRLAAAPKYGNDQPGVDALAAEIADFVYHEIRSVPCGRVRFLPAHIMLEAYHWAGQLVGATPDGRRAGEPLSDSTGPMQGRDTSGPTAMLKSVARLPQRLAIGTPVLNMRFSKSTLSSPEARRRLRTLIETYFQLGGMQLQITAVDRAELEDALLHPELHENLIVRIGGYSTFFNRLSMELKKEVLKRTEYAFES